MVSWRVGGPGAGRTVLPWRTVDLDLLCDTLGWNKLHGGKPSDDDGLGEVLQQLRSGVAGQGRVEPGGVPEELAGDVPEDDPYLAGRRAELCHTLLHEGDLHKGQQGPVAQHEQLDVRSLEGLHVQLLAD